MADEMQGWQSIETAPKDGRVIVVAHWDCGSFPMAWNSAATNHLFAPGETGMWEMPDRSMTWRSAQDGPSHWKHLDDPAALDALNLSVSA